MSEIDIPARQIVAEHHFLAFGIPSLDRLIGVKDGQSHLDRQFLGYSLTDSLEHDRSEKDDRRKKDDRQESATFCVIGPDGTGKSNFALHMASDYFRRTACQPCPPKIIYASSDLSYERAEKIWEAFWLDRPLSRYDRLPFERDWHRHDEPLTDSEIKEWKKENRLTLECYSPTGDTLAEFLVRDTTAQKKIAFLDLESDTSGDDWAMLHSLLAAMRTPEKDCPRHLLIIDAIEGLETLVGERDSFGQVQSRRARIAQIVRAASRKCHLVFVVEEPREGERLPEVFVSDVVVRLRSVLDRDYGRRTVELEKVRGQKHIRGQHDFRIRQEGSKSGENEFNPDDPAVGCPHSSPTEAGEYDRMAYIQVFPSLHYLSRDIPKQDLFDTPTPSRIAVPHAQWRYAAFGIYQMDTMLWQASKPGYKSQEELRTENPQFCLEDEKTQLSLCFHLGQRPRCLKDFPSDDLERVFNELIQIRPESCSSKPCPGFDRMGLPAGSITTLIGNDSTYKSHLARSFLSQAFRARDVLTSEPAHLPVVVANENDPLKGQGVAVLIATYDTNRRLLERKYLPHHLIATAASISDDPLYYPTQRDGLAKRLLVRSLEAHHLPSSAFAHMVHELIKEAKRQLSKGLGETYTGKSPEAKKILHGRIRVVIDDWSTLLAVYPEVQRDPLLLPYLMRYFRREGVTVLILATRSGNPNERGPGDLEPDIRELRSMADHHLHTWHVSFFDERRVAITVQPSPLPGAGSMIRELRPARVDELPRNLMSSLEAMAPQVKFLSPKERADHQEHFDEETVVVDPHFELYSGLQDGQPTPVSLRVYLYAEKQGIPLFDKYLREFDDLFRHLFGHNSEGMTLQAKYGNEYEKLRELSYLQSEARLKHTLVLQVDEFWAESRSELLRQERYLTARTVDSADRSPETDHGTRRPIKTEDPFGLFFFSESMRKRLETGSERLRESSPLKRYHFFDPIGYDIHQAMKLFPIDKVPYSWDFGFLICDRVLWERFRELSDHRTRKVVGPGEDEVDPQTLGKIWDRLWKIGPPLPSEIQDMLELPSESGLLGASHSEAEEGEAADLEAYWNDLDSPPEQVPGPDDKNFEWRWVINRKTGQPRPKKDSEYSRTPSEEQSQVSPNEKGKLVEKSVTWREFFGACKTIAKATRREYIPFDIDLLATESFSCHVLEVWFSEVYQAWRIRKNGKKEEQTWADEFEKSRWWPANRRECPSSYGFKQLLGAPQFGSIYGSLFRRALYRTILLLDEVLGHERMLGGELSLEARQVHPKAIASRHWYSTATVAMSDPIAARTQMLVGMPGAYSVRGDWFLAVSRGSRSARLGERAIDILNSRRANIVRLQAGLGLPVRDLFGPKDQPADQELRKEYWTPLYYEDDDFGRQPIPYRELRKLGAFDPKDYLGRGNFYWLWRSAIAQYDIHSRMWQKWLVKLFREWREWELPVVLAYPEDREKYPDSDLSPPQHLRYQPWWDEFCEYDHYLRFDHYGSPAEPCYVEERDNPRWNKFKKSCDSLIEALDRAGNSPNHPEEGASSVREQQGGQNEYRSPGEQESGARSQEL